MSILETILIGSLSSLIATFIWVTIIYFIDFSARKKIFFLLEECDPSVRMLLNSVQYHSYIVALSQVEKISSILIQIYGSLKVFNFSSKKRKLIKGTSKNYVLRTPISQKTRKTVQDKGIKVIYQIFQSASTDFFNQ